MSRQLVLAATAVMLLTSCSGSDDPAASEDESRSPSATMSINESPATPPPGPTFEPREDIVVGRIETGAGSGPSGVAVGPGAVWVTTHRSGELLRIDPSTRNLVARVEIPGGADFLEAAPIVTQDAVVLCVGGESARVVSVDPATNKVRTRPYGGDHVLEVRSGF